MEKRISVCDSRDSVIVTAPAAIASATVILPTRHRDVTMAQGSHDESGNCLRDLMTSSLSLFGQSLATLGLRVCMVRAQGSGVTGEEGTSEM